MRPDGTCRSCGAPVRWAVSYTTSKRIPLDPTPRADGNLGVVEWAGEDGAALPLPLVAFNPGPHTQATPYRYVSHFATCPNADNHRKAR